jgi:hypothetical protein
VYCSGYFLRLRFTIARNPLTVGGDILQFSSVGVPTLKLLTNTLAVKSRSAAKISRINVELYGRTWGINALTETFHLINVSK